MAVGCGQRPKPAAGTVGQASSTHGLTWAKQRPRAWPPGPSQRHRQRTCEACPGHTEGTPGRQRLGAARLPGGAGALGAPMRLPHAPHVPAAPALLLARTCRCCRVKVTCIAQPIPAWTPRTQSVKQPPGSVPRMRDASMNLTSPLLRASESWSMLAAADRAASGGLAVPLRLAAARSRLGPSYQSQALPLHQAFQVRGTRVVVHNFTQGQ